MSAYLKTSQLKRLDNTILQTLKLNVFINIKDIIGKFQRLIHF